ncbi:MAG: class I SAM-dependent methyltransferase [Actinomycetota bacterium]|nr:class I SAM-dependent methyltransferase [Actinomycetota bacterium]
MRHRRQYKPDRHILENVIFPALLAREDVRRVLFVGCAWYTQSYAASFHDRLFCTMDIDERVRRYGADHHVVASMTDIADYFDPGSLDVVICNGVVGFGLDSEHDCDRAFEGTYAALRPGGLLIVGWDDAEGCRPTVALDDLKSVQAFHRGALPPFPSWRYPTFSPLGHTFDFYVKPYDDGGTGR